MKPLEEDLIVAVSKYTNPKDGKEYFKVRIVRKSRREDTGEPVSVEKRAQLIKTHIEALKIEKKLNQEAERELYESKDAQVKWGSLVKDWYEAAWNRDIFARGLSKTTADNYQSILTEHTSCWSHFRIDEIDKAKAWLLLERVERNVSIVRRKKVRTVIDAVYRWGMLSGRIKGTVAIPTEGYSSSKRQEEKLPEILLLNEIKAFLKAAKVVDHLWYPIWVVALMTGMRSGELYALEWSSVDFDNNLLYVHRNWTNKEGIHATKGGYWRTVPMSDDLTRFLKELRLKTPKEQLHVLPRWQAWTDGNQAEITRTFCIGHGIPSIKFHTLRACFATQLIQAGVAPGQIMKICGWKDLKTMQRYIRLAGIEVKGATDGLKIIPHDQIMGTVVELFGAQT